MMASDTAPGRKDDGVGRTPHHDVGHCTMMSGHPTDIAWVRDPRETPSPIVTTLLQVSTLTPQKGVLKWGDDVTLFSNFDLQLS